MDTCSPTRLRSASSASIAATPPPAMTTRGRAARMPRGRGRNDSGMARHQARGAGERLERLLGAARDDDHGAGGTVDEPAGDAAEQDASEGAVAPGAADEQVDAVAELPEGDDRAITSTSMCDLTAGRAPSSARRSVVWARRRWA